MFLGFDFSGSGWVSGLVGVFFQFGLVLTVFWGFGWLWVFVIVVIVAKKKGTWKKRLISVPGYLISEEKHRIGSCPKRVIIFLSPLLFPLLLCKLLS